MRRNVLLSSFVLMMFVAPRTWAQDARPHHVHTGAIIQYGVAESKMLWALMTATQVDDDLIDGTVSELERITGSAKASVDRTVELLDEKQEKLKPELVKLRDQVASAAKQLTKLKEVIDGQLKPYIKSASKDDNPDIEQQRAEAAPEPDWEALKSHIGWVYQDLSAAEKMQEQLAKKLGIKVSIPAPPKGKRS